MRNNILAIMSLTRPVQMLKNLLIALPLCISGELYVWLSDIRKFEPLIYSLLGFTLASILVYIINDIKDLERDRLNPKRVHRPLAAGLIKPNLAMAVAVIITTALFAVLFKLSGFAISLILFYITINLLYCYWLKHTPYWELLIVSSGYIIRVLLGSSLLIMQPSLEFYTFILFFALSIVTAKRLSEIMSNSVSSRPVLQHYSIQSLSVFFYISISNSIFSYTTFVIKLIASSNFTLILSITSLFSLLVLLVVLFRFISLSIKGLVESPEQLLIHDKFIQTHIIIFTILVFFIGYLR